MEEQISRIAQLVQSNLGLPEEQQPLVLRYVRRVVNRIRIFCSRKDLPPPLEEVSSITRGDTSIHYRDKASAFQNAAAFIRDYESQLIPFKRMKIPRERPYD